LLNRQYNVFIMYVGAVNVKQQKVMIFDRLVFSGRKAARSGPT